MSVLGLVAAQKAQRAAKKARRAAKAKRIGTKKVTLSKAKKALWTELSRAIRAEYGPRCYTCPGPGMQAGHMRPKGYSHTLSAWYPGNLRPQCLTCNLHLGGNGAEFRDRYVAQYGQEAYDHVTVIWKTPHKWTVPEIQILTEKIKLGLEHYAGYYEAMYCEKVLTSLV